MISKIGACPFASNGMENTSPAPGPRFWYRIHGPLPHRYRKVTDTSGVWFSIVTTANRGGSAEAFRATEIVATKANRQLRSERRVIVRPFLFTRPAERRRLT